MAAVHAALPAQDRYAVKWCHPARVATAEDQPRSRASVSRSGWFNAFMTRGTRKASPYSTTQVSWSVVRIVVEKALGRSEVTLVASPHWIVAILSCLIRSPWL